jgi:hypothetical protein
MVKLTARLKYAWHRHGPIGFVWLTAYNIVYHIIGRHRSANPSRDSFDQRYDTNTRGIREIGSLDVNTSAAAQYAVRYEPSNAQLVWAALDRLKIDHSRFIFIDFGSGKGRALLVAAEFPFIEVLGIEFSRELHEIALENIARIPPYIARAGRILSIHSDAALFELPKSDIVCYFYNPFGPPIITAVAELLAAHHEDYGYRIIIIYADPNHREVFERTGKFVVFDETPETLILTTLQKSDDRPIGSFERSG